jgi:UDP-glucose 4-epimerase
MSNVLVTGATGLIGRHFLNTFPDTRSILALCRSEARDLPVGVRSIRHDFESGAALQGLPADIDTIVHLAQAEDYRRFPEAARQIFSVCAQSTLDLLEWGRNNGVKRFILASTGGLYAPSAAPVRESDPLRIDEGPLAFYLTAKQTAEHLAQRYAPFMTVIILRFFFVYGPGQRPAMLLPRLIASVREARSILLQGERGTIMNPLHADDAARALIRACALDESGVINVAGPEAVSIREIARRIGETLGVPPTFQIDAQAAAPCITADITEMRRRLGPPLIHPLDGAAAVAEAFPR